MSTTNWGTAKAFETSFPHTFISLQYLVMSMADFAKNKGRISFFGKDKGLAAYKKFESKLRDTILSMVMDGIIKRDTEAYEVRLKLLSAIDLFKNAFPNWQDAYVFANEFLGTTAGDAEDRIQKIMH
nr:hypothetical protein [Desulfobacula sp.]